MQLDLILRGQSNAILLAEGDHWAASGHLVNEVERLLGFDGEQNSVRLIYDRDEQGGETAYSGTAFLGEWMQRDASGNWTSGKLENGFLDGMQAYREDGMGDATALVWMHSEYDSRDPDLATADWTSAVRTDAALVRGELGRDVPYLFVAAHPYGDGTDAGHQAIRAGMEQLAADPAFDARIAARAPDIDAAHDNRDGNSDTKDYGGAHITPEDGMLIADRIARAVAEDWAEFAQPGSPVAVAGGNIADHGPRVVQAQQIDATRLKVDVQHDAAPTFGALGASAAEGLGWTAGTADGERIAASGVQVLDHNSLLVSFADAVPAGARLDYAWGIGRVAEPGGPGEGNALTDISGLPVWTPAEGVAVTPATLDALWG